MTACRAALDLGSNLIRVAVGTRSRGQNTQVLHKEVRVARVAEGLGGAGGTIQAEPMDRAISAVDQLRVVAEAHGCRIDAAVATGALRLAANRDAVIQAIEFETGVSIEIIEGDREARLSMRGVLSSSGEVAGFGGKNRPKHGDGGITLVDIGGTTTEVVHTAPVRTNALSDRPGGGARSFDIGVITLSEWGQAHSADDHALKARAAGVFQGLPRAPEGSVCFAAGGAAVALSAWRRRESFLNYVGWPDESLTPKERADIYREFLEATPEERGRRLQVSTDHAALVPAGYAILAALTDALVLADVRPTGRGVVEGLLDEVLAADR